MRLQTTDVTNNPNLLIAKNFILAPVINDLQYIRCNII